MRARRVTPTPLSLLLASLVFVTAPAACYAEIIHVPGDYPTFRQGLSATDPGDTLLVAHGIYDEPGEPAIVRPGVRVMGLGWEANPLSGTVLRDIELTFSAGADSAVVENLAIARGRVSSDNSRGTLRGCAVGDGTTGNWPDEYVALSRGGITIEHCFIRCDVTGGQRSYFVVQGGDVTIRNNVIALISAGMLLDVTSITPFESGRVDVTDNTISAMSAMTVAFRDVVNPVAGPILFQNNIMQSIWIGLTCVTQADVEIEYNDFFAISVQSLCGPMSATNLRDDPLLCDPHYLECSLDDFALDARSPCIGAGGNGTTIGALEVGCGLVAVGDASATPEARVDFELFPNPAASGQKLWLRLRHPMGTARIARIVDTNGRVREEAVTLTWSLGNGYVESSMSPSLSPGVYYIDLEHDGRHSARKLVIHP